MFGTVVSTTAVGGGRQSTKGVQPRVAIVGRDPELRLHAARAFDRAPIDWAVRLFETVPSDADAVVVCPDMDAVGIEFDPENPQRVLDDVAKKLSVRFAGLVVNVAGVGGGVGTTTIALHLSAALARRGPTCYVELDPNRAARFRLDLGQEVPTWDAADPSEDGLMRAAIPVEGGFRVLLAPDEIREPDVGSLLNRCTTSFRHVVVDLGSDRHSQVTIDSPSLLVMPPSVVAAQRVRESADGRPERRWAIVTNRVGPGSEATRKRLEQICGRSIDVELPCSPALRDREDEGRLLRSAWSPWCRRIDRLAAGIATR